MAQRNVMQVVQRLDGFVSIPGWDHGTRKATIIHEDEHALVVKLPGRTCPNGARGFGTHYVEPEMMVFEKLGRWGQHNRRTSRGERYISVRALTTISLGKGWSTRTIPHPDAEQRTPHGNLIRPLGDPLTHGGMHDEEH